MAEAYIIDAVRTPVGRRGGGLSQVHPADLGAHSIRALVERTGVDPAAIEDVVFGNVDSIGPQAGDIARTCGLVAGLPEHVPGTTVDRQCGSAQQAVHFAAQAVMSGTIDLVVAGGVQNMSMIPIGAAMVAGQAYGHDTPFSGSPGWQARYGDQEVSQFRGAELIAEKWDISREDMEEFAVESHARALRARAEGRFEQEIEPLGDCTFDEGPREPDWDKIRSLPPLIEGGRLTAAVSSQISDGSAALLVASEQAVKEHGLNPRARVHHLSVRGDDPVYMLSAPIPATAYALERTGLTPDDIDLVEINEAFASVVLAWQKETGFDLAKVNVNGGAIALGHPLGATGARLMTTLLNELDRAGGRYGLQTMCEGGGQANVTILERLERVASVIDIPAGTRVYGVQLPIQAQSRMIAADWERDAGVDDLARVARVADDNGYHYVGVCDHIALTEDYAARMSTFWQDCIGTLSWLAAITTRTNLLSHAYVLPYRHPLVAAKQFATLDYLSGGRAIVGIGAGHVEPEFERLGVDFHRRGRLVDEKLPVLIDALEHEWVEGYGASPRPVQQPRPPVWVAGSSPAAIERAARLADGWLPQGPSDATMVTQLLEARARHDRAAEPMMIGHIAPWLYVGSPSWEVPEDSLVGPAAALAEQILDGTPDGVNQIQVRFRARGVDELCDQMVAFASGVAPALTKV